MNYLSKRKNNTYCIMLSYVQFTKYASMEKILCVAKECSIKLSEKIWSAEKMDWIIED